MHSRITLLTVAAAALFAVSAQAQTMAPDGTKTNPPGTAVSRTVDRAAGTNTSGAFPAQSDGTPANPRGTAVSRTLGTTHKPVHTARTHTATHANPPGTAASRAADRAAGTNVSGAYPAQSDGTPANPAGTAVGRAVAPAAR